MFICFISEILNIQTYILCMGHIFQSFHLNSAFQGISLQIIEESEMCLY